MLCGLLKQGDGRSTLRVETDKSVFSKFRSSGEGKEQSSRGTVELEGGRTIAYPSIELMAKLAAAVRTYQFRSLFSSHADAASQSHSLDAEPEHA